MLSSTFAPCRACWNGGPSGNQMSSQMENPVGTPPDVPDPVGVGADHEVAVLVEYTEVGQVHLVIHPRDLAPGEDGGGIGDPAGGGVDAVAAGSGGEIEEPDDGRHGGRATCQPAHGRDVRLDEVPPQDEVLGRVADEGELGEQQHVGSGGDGTVHGGGDPLLIAPDIADGEVDLGSGDLEWHVDTIRLPLPIGDRS